MIDRRYAFVNNTINNSAFESSKSCSVEITLINLN